MSEIINRFIDKEVIITVMNSDVVSIMGFVREVKDNWVVVETADKGLDAVNIDYITRIREHPRKANGKKKQIF